MEISKNTPFTLIIDEFQEFLQIAPSAYSEMQHYWDINKQDSKINLIVSGSVHSLMHRIFEDKKEPLFGRAGKKLHIKSFEISVVKSILSENFANYTNEDLLALYSFTGGVPKYIELFMDSRSYTKKRMLNHMISENSIFLNEGVNMLVSEFGKEYATYFSILSAIARGENTRRKIQAIINKEVGGYLTKLEKNYNLIYKAVPLYSKVESKNVRYEICDNFLYFWFRFIYKYSYMIEINAFDELKTLINRDYPTYSGKMLERYYTNAYIEKGGYTRIGNYWDKKGETEIDLIAVNDINKTVQFAEIKRNPDNINLNLLQEKAILFNRVSGKLKDYSVSYKALSLNNM